LNALRRFGRRRRERREQADGSPPFAVERCECIRDGDFALLRVTGTGAARPVALIIEADDPQVFEPLPDPGGSDGTWRAAFALPGDLAVPGQAVSLHDGVAYRVELSLPGDGPARPPDSEQPVVAAAVEVSPDAAALAARAASNADDTRARKLVEAWSEASRLREKLNDREEELAEALKELLDAREERRPLRERADAAERALAPTREELETVREELRVMGEQLEAARAEVARTARDAAAERSRHGVETAELEEAAAELRAELEKLREGGGRRLGLRRRAEDGARAELEQRIAELERLVAERDGRVEQLEREAESFGQRRDEAVADSLRDHVAKLEEQLGQQEVTAGDLRALLDSEREQVARARAEADALKRKLATATAGARAASEPVAPAPEAGAGEPDVAAGEPDAAAGEPDAKPGGKESPPWSAVDDELLARIERAKALAR
jgi:hypothetical protein